MLNHVASVWQVPAATQARHQVAGLEQLVEMLQEREQAYAQLQQVEQVTQSPELPDYPIQN